MRTARPAIKTVDLKSDMPTVDEALQRLERIIAMARNEDTHLLKIVHGYGSKGVGGEIRVAVQKRLREMADGGLIRECIFGEDWSTGNDAAWKLLQERPALKQDAHLGRRNQGITIVVL